MAVIEISEPARGRPAEWREFGVEALVRVLGLSGVGFVILIFLFLLREGLPAFGEVELGNLFSTAWYPTFDRFGIVPLILGSLLVTVGAIAVALPLGVAVAVYLGEIAPRPVREVLKPMIEVIAGIPSVVLGFVGIVAFSPWVRTAFDAPTGLTALTGSLLLAYMALPTIITVAEDALDVVPRSYRDGALALGATEWQTIWGVVLPAARSGILT
ncbi:MAG TPA: ABC transporter permease subunit, partial [Ardenticatenaceae bacterium]|nr:ABC transporter permease subunit [Ardenticatenaceae bacterium]